MLYNDDTSMKVLRLAREPSDERTGVFTSGIVSTRQGQKIALFFTGRQHAGENLAEVLKRRAQELNPAIQMCDVLSRNVPKFAGGVEILVANCLAHGRRQFVNVAGSFRDECRYVLEALGEVYGHEAAVRERGLAPPERLRLFTRSAAVRSCRNCTNGWRRSWLNTRRSRTRDWGKRFVICCGTGNR